MNFFDYFYEISAISRPSGDCAAIADYICSFAEKHSLKYTRDHMNSVIIFKDATKGYEDRDTVMLQGHTDMVCCCDEGVLWDFSQGVKVINDGEFLTADGTTLGADNGIAVAYMLAILSDDSIPHGPIECVFTSDEETGLYGADAIDLSECKAKYLINLDSEEEGIITAGCCGGLTMNIAFNEEKEFVPGEVYKLTMTGFRGGHSGVNIDNFVEVRYNAIVTAVHPLKLACENPQFRLVSMDGGEKDNAIARSMSIVLCGGDFEKVKAAAELVTPGIKAIENDAVVTVEKISDDGAYAFSREFTDTLIGYFNGIPNGVLDRIPDEPGLPPSISDNFGVVTTEGDTITATLSFRAYDDSYRDRYSAKVAKESRKCGAEVTVKGKYPGWERAATSPLRDKMCQVWKDMTGEEMKVQRIHAGLECGVLIAKKPELDAVSIGPEMSGVHTPDEKVSIASAERCYKFICEVLKSI